MVVCGAMPPSRRRTLDVPDLASWRAWLRAHHDVESEIWLVFHKRATGRPSIAYGDALDEALCFGWIDSLVARLDDRRYARKFTPRKSDSRWSDINRTRYARLKAAGRLMPSGENRAPTDRRSVAPPSREWEMPDYMRAALRKRPSAWKTFESLPPSHRRHYIGWIDSAKKAETKQRRLQEAIELLAAGKRLGLK